MGYEPGAFLTVPSKNRLVQIDGSKHNFTILG